MPPPGTHSPDQTTIALPHRQADDSLRRSEEELAEFFENAPLGLHWVGPDGIVLRVNRTELEMLGYTREEFVGRRIADFHADVPVIEDMLRRLQAGEELRDFEARLRCKDGSIRHVLITSNVLWQDGRFMHTRCFTRDVTDQKRTEQTIQFLSEGDADYTCVVRFSGKELTVESASEGFAQVTGYTLDEFNAGVGAFAVHPDDILLVLDSLARMTRGEVVCNEARMITKGGETRWLRYLGQPLAGPAEPPGLRIHGAVQDVTERKQAGERLQEAERRFRQLADNIQEVFWMSDPLRTQFLYCSPAYEQVWGRSRADLYQQPWLLLDSIVPEDRDRFAAALDKQSQGEVTDLEYRIRRPDGSVRWIRDRSFPLKELSGQVYRVAGVADDITDRKQADEALRRSEVQFRQLADALPQLVWTARPDGYIDWYNERWYQFTGFGREAYGEHSWKPILHPDDVERSLDTYYGCIRSGQLYQIEYRFKDRVTGGYRWFLGRAYPVRDEQGHIIRWFGTCTDIDDNKRAEETLQRRNERLGLLNEAAEYLLATDDPHAMVRGLFERVRDHLGVDAYFNFMVSEAGDALQLMSAAGIAETDMASISRLDFGQAISGTVALERRPVCATFIQASDDPQVQQARSMGLRVFACNPLLAGQRLLGTLAFASRTRDRFEEDELEFLRTLCHDAAAAFERVRLIGQLRAADQRKDEFLATLAHELRNPLAPIRNSLHILRLSGGSRPGVERVQEMMERQVSHMVRLVDDLLEVSRITRGKIELRKERVELSAIVASAVETSRPLIEGSRHLLTLSLPTERLTLEADPMRLAQVIANLLNNAAKYTEEGGQIWLNARREESEAVVSIRDNGLGMPHDMLPHVFDLFAQADRTIGRAQGGLGIGLTLVRSLVQLHGGRVEARSEGPGRGSEFIVRLPLAAEPGTVGQGVSGVSGQQPAVLLPLRVLVVDDNHDAGDSLGILLTYLGADVQVVYDGLSALELIRSYRPAVVLLDIDLPGADGYEVARRVRREPGLQATTLIALTGWGQEEDRRRSLQAGFDHHLVKPVDVEALQVLLASLPSQKPHG